MRCFCIMKIMRWLIQRLTDEAMCSTIMEDLDYRFSRKKEENGSLVAFLHLLIQCTFIIIPIVVENIFGGLAMLKNYIKIALRNIKKQKVNSFINISGLAVGLAAVILLLLYIQYEISYDRFHEKADRIYRVAIEEKESRRLGIATPAPLAPLMRADFPEVEDAVRFMKRDNRLVSYHDQHFIENNFFFVDPEIFDLFSLELLEGNPEAVLSNPNSVVITETMAKKYFGHENPIGKIIRFEDVYDFQVTGILTNLPENSHFQVNFLAPFLAQEQIWKWIDLPGWRFKMYQTYFTVKENMRPTGLEQKIYSIYRDHYGDEYAGKYTFLLQPLTRIHLHSNATREIGNNADLQTIYILTLIALLILMIASINYTNLTTAQSSRRLKEIGLRKVIGANRNQLIKQFIGESFIVTAFSFIIAFFIAGLALPAFNTFVGRNLSLNFMANTEFLVWLCTLLGAVGLFAGIYPAFSIAAVRPTSLLKERAVGFKKSKLRTSLVVAQFTISIILIIITFIIKGQMHFVRTTNVGYTKDNIVVVDMNDERIEENIENIKIELLRNPNISSVAASSYLPHNTGGNNLPSWPGKPDDLEVQMYFNPVDYDFLDLYNIELVEGRNFSREFPSDANGAVILNETALKTIGWESGVGKDFIHATFNDEKKPLKIVGVVKDFHMLSLHQPIAPFYFTCDLEHAATHLSVKIRGENTSEPIQYIQDVLKRFSPNYPFNYQFFEDMFNSTYRSEQKLGNVFSFFSILAIIIACMGLFGLALFSTIQRAKEIGIRKVLGASVSGIVMILSKEFTGWVLLANVIAWPVAYYASNRWLEQFAYRIDITLWVFLASGMFALVIAVFTVCYQSIRAALANPVESLRYE